MKIYVITCGEYSDYHICAVTDDPVSAERLKILHSSWCEADIEEYETEHPKEKPDTYWHVLINEFDQIIECYEVPIADCVIKDLHIGEIRLSTNYRYRYSFNVFAKDYSHAVKSAIDHLAEYKYRTSTGEI